ncbi:MAG: metal-dependent transcriptional regulator [Clostridia bacterium]|nr:metal-dependent transcriptional regulator [Clostridia bacterium]
MAIHESGEMYLETIYVLTKEKGMLRSIDVCEHMGYSKPSVSRAVNLLKANGFILIDKDGYITLTESGHAIGKKIYERHTLLSSLLLKLGVPPEIAAEDACKLEHAISDVSFEAIKRYIGNIDET